MMWFHPPSPRLLSALMITLAMAHMTGCEARDTVATTTQGYVQSPFGYMPPYEMGQSVPIEIGPLPVPMTTVGDPVTIFVHTATPPIEVIVDDQGIRPEQLLAQPGQLFTIRLFNQSVTDRGLRLSLPNAIVELPQNARPGEVRTLQFAVPTQPGTYRFVSFAPAATQDGPTFEGTLIVEVPR